LHLFSTEEKVLITATGPLFGAVRRSPHSEVLKGYLVNRVTTVDSLSSKILAGIKTKQ